MTVPTQLKNWLHAAYSGVKRTVQDLWRRLLNEPGYADAAANLAVCAAEIWWPNRVLAAPFHQVAQTLAALVRDMIRNRQRHATSTWEPDPAWVN